MFKFLCSIYVLFIVICSIFIHVISGNDNICKREESYVELEETKSIYPVRVRSNDWCLNIPPRCTNYRTEMKEVVKFKNASKIRLIEECCEGYMEVKQHIDNHHNQSKILCQPICDNGCGHGNCITPNNCLCNVGYSGSDCMDKCKYDMWGENCKNKCKCKNGAICNALTGYCQCRDGWIGEMCEFPCPDGYFGKMCKNNCSHCQFHKCHGESGKCFDNFGGGAVATFINRTEDYKFNHFIKINGNGKISLTKCNDSTTIINNNCTLTSIRHDDKLNNLENSKRIRNINEQLMDHPSNTSSVGLLQSLNATFTKLSDNIKQLDEHVHEIDKPVAQVTILVQPQLPSVSSPQIDIVQTLLPASNYQQLENLHSSNIDDLLQIPITLVKPIVENEADLIGQQQQQQQQQQRERIILVNTLEENHENHDLNHFDMSEHSSTIGFLLIGLMILTLFVFIIFGFIYFHRRNAESMVTTNSNRNTIESNQQIAETVVLKTLPVIPSFTNNIQRKQDKDFYDKPQNNRSIREGLNRFGYSYSMEDEKLRTAISSENIYDEVKYPIAVNTMR